MPDQYDIRAELPLGTHRDFKVGGIDLRTARERAQEYIEDNITSNYVNRYDWRGQVVFINCGPAEEAMPRGQKQKA